MNTMLIVAITSVIITFIISYFIYQYNNPYVDEIEDSGELCNSSKTVIGSWVFYKRTYKNGKIKFFEKRYK